MKIIEAQPDWQSRYPAFAWCVEQGEGWYLPAINELIEVHENQDIINDALKSSKGTPLFDGNTAHYYWSSTERGEYTAFGGYMYLEGGPRPEATAKYYVQQVRAVASF